MEKKNNRGFKICTVGWEPYFVNYLLVPIAKKTGIEFTHGLVGDASRIKYAQRKYPTLQFVSLSKTKKEFLPEPDCALLASMECLGVPTVKSGSNHQEHSDYSSVGANLR